MIYATRFLMIPIAAAAMVACGPGGTSGDAPPLAGSSPLVGGQTTAAGGSAGAAQGTTATERPMATRLWNITTVVKRITDAGFVPQQKVEPVTHPFTMVPGTAFSMGSYGDLEVFLYADSAAVRRVVDGLDTLAVSPRAGPVMHWRYMPTLITNSNLVAVLLSSNEHFIERIQLALHAGAPPPDR